MQDAITKGSDALLEKGILGILVVLLASAVAWLMLRNQRLQEMCDTKTQAIQNARIEELKQNTKDMMAVYQKVEQILDQVEKLAGKR